MAVFVLQKLVFLIVNAGYGDGLHFVDWRAVVWHGLHLDLVTTCYLLMIPLLVAIVAMFVPRMHLRPWLVWWYVVASLVVTLVFVADLMLYSFWGAKLDAADLIYAQNPKDLLASLPVWLIVVAFVGIGLLTAGLTWLWWRLTPRQSERWRPWWAGVVAAVLLVGLNLVGMRGGLSASTANPSYAYFSQRLYLNHAALNPTFNLFHSMAKADNLATEFVFYSDDEVDRRVAGLYEHHADIADTLLTTQHPNIILLVWEGGGTLMTGNDSIAPCFAQLKRQGVFFSRCHANNFRTDRGLVSLLNGWLGLPTTSLMKTSGRCEFLPSIAKHLRAHGYHSAFYYGGDIDFTNMRGYFYQTGYDQVYGGTYYSWAPDQSKWGADDQYLLQLPATAADPVPPLPEAPFFATYLTLSSHEPWTVPYRRLADDKANSFAYTDSCIGTFVHQLQHSPLWDSLLLIIVPDHGVSYDGYALADSAVSRIPILWLGGAVRQPAEYTMLMNQSDLAATLMAQLGIDFSDFPFSRNVLSAHYQPTVVVHAFKNGLNLIDTTHCARFDCVDHQVVPAAAAGTTASDADEQLAKALLQLVYRESARLH